MGFHLSYGIGITECYPTQVNTPCCNPSQTGRYLIYPYRRNRGPVWPRYLVTYRDGLPAYRWSPI